MISIDNFTVTVISFPEFVGADWTLDNPQAVLQLTPNAGYQILAQNFSATNPLPTYVSSVSFLQDGTNILCTITYTQPSIMPAQDVFIDVCFEGLASPIDTITVNGEIDYSIQQRLFQVQSYLYLIPEQELLMKQMLWLIY